MTSTPMKLQTQAYRDCQALEPLRSGKVELHLSLDGIAIEEQRGFLRIYRSAPHFEGSRSRPFRSFNEKRCSCLKPPVPVRGRLGAGLYLGSSSVSPFMAQRRSGGIWELPEGVMRNTTCGFGSRHETDQATNAHMGLRVS
jgi:hypothetical protein